MKNSRYKSNFIPGEKYTKGYWEFAVYSKKIFFIIAAFLIWAISFLSTFDPAMHLFSVFFVLALYMNYSHWREMQQGKTS